MRNEDDFADLFDRVNTLPTGVQQVYQQMWKHLDRDEQRYRDKAAQYFTYQSFYPMSIFEILVAIDKPLQDNHSQASFGKMYSIWSNNAKDWRHALRIGV